jgi:hypothetical protein
VNDGVDSSEIHDGQFSDVLGDDHRSRQTIVEKPATPIETGIDPDRIVAASKQLRSEYGANVAIRTCKQHPHSLLLKLEWDTPTNSWRTLFWADHEDLTVVN